MAHKISILTLTAALSLAAVTLILNAGNVSANAVDTTRKSWKPAEIKTMVAFEARQIGLPVALALAVAKVESDFRPHLESNKGARGVMQIMPATALEEYAIPAKMLWNPRINIRLGLHFLQRLLVRYRGRTDLALSYYNGGSRVGDLPNARVMPATRGYVEKVRNWQQRFQRQVWLDGAEWKSSKRPGMSWKRERVLN
ncbi:MAG: lytic transglycosylase domain-containing protein [Alphaproteobacteria bacterium]|jgi:soluble lytic murein transglycosylase-like protein|nr:lytic transglycosylase domain-containing protein [Alphaproteobacteria bacterium]MBT4083698.1 lytic transglycosylase domain-containing protein [Alphaproteobacteria bacterium]MBT4545220.1 lytic transglycosylase domain-containing protein [Alphaproteobacteria bacterium]MBT7744608.1 lytic transglycosylase domain-containing protein [Alphaproteobacteria bacterium]